MAPYAHFESSNASKIFHTAGALAIVGTEAPAFSALVTEFASQVGSAWWSGSVTLGAIARRQRARVAVGDRERMGSGQRL